MIVHLTNLHSSYCFLPLVFPESSLKFALPRMHGQVYRMEGCDSRQDGDPSVVDFIVFFPHMTDSETHSSSTPIS